MLRHKRAQIRQIRGTNSPDKGKQSSSERDNISDSDDDRESRRNWKNDSERGREPDRPSTYGPQNPETVLILPGALAFP